jgi:hypothetical protein
VTKTDADAVSLHLDYAAQALSNIHRLFDQYDNGSEAYRWGVLRRAEEALAELKGEFPN